MTSRPALDVPYAACQGTDVHLHPGWSAWWDHWMSEGEFLPYATDSRPQPTGHMGEVPPRTVSCRDREVQHSTASPQSIARAGEQ
ncbi:MAG: hypothetical protein CL878_03595 [Dehalococcoidia bacterium]|nr:hypothetical protein [Dehalococcoidia bacterium]